MEEAMSQDDCSSWKSQRPAMMTANDYVLVPNLHAFLVSLLVPFTFLILQQGVKNTNVKVLNPLNAELYPICHLLALLGAHHILHVSRIRVNLCLLSFLRYFIYSQSKHFSLQLLPKHP